MKELNLVLFFLLALLLTACAPSAAPTAPPPPSQIDAANHPPVILRVEEREEMQNGQLFLSKDIYFTDPDGDATTVVNTLISTDPAEFSGPWRAEAEAGPQQAVGPVHALAEAADLAADEAAGDGVRVSSIQGDHAPVGERNREAAGIGAVERARGADLVSAAGLRHEEVLVRTAWPSFRSRRA